MTSPIPQEHSALTSKRTGVHITHCCTRHGCKYGDSDCPVHNRRAAQAYLCALCDEDNPRTVLTMEAAAAIRTEDSEQALILTLAPDQEDEGEWAELRSWYANGSHAMLRPLAGRQLRITVQLVDDCPRCGLPLDPQPAVSRTDNSSLICMSCEIDETLLLRDNRTLPVREEWPVHDRYIAELDAPHPRLGRQTACDHADSTAVT